MIEALGDVGPLFAVGGAGLAVAFTLRDLRKRLEQAERLMWLLREDQTRLLELLRDDRRALPEAAEQPAQGLPQGSEGLERRLRLDSEARIEALEREIRRLREEARASRLVTAGASEGETQSPAAPKHPKRERPASRARISGAPAGLPETAASPELARKAAKPEGGGRDLGVWHPHPDEVGRKQASPVQPSSRPRKAAPVEMFRKHYDRYLENYRGYVELAEDLYRTRDGGDSPDASGRREWEERLRRLQDGMERTTARLDILEQHNPELATDDRISRRADIARRHAALT